MMLQPASEFDTLASGSMERIADGTAAEEAAISGVHDAGSELGGVARRDLDQAWVGCFTGTPASERCEASSPD